MFYACLSISYFFNRNLRPVLIFGGRGGGGFVGHYQLF